MIGNKEYKILIKSGDFQGAIAPYGPTWSASETSAPNTIYHDTAAGHVVVNSATGIRGYVYLLFENMSIGDLIEAEMSVKCVDGSAGISKMASIGIHHVNDVGAADAGQTFVQQSFPMTDEWETVKLSQYCTESRRVRVDFGMYSEETGTFYIKFGRAQVTKLRTP